jgi:Mrp family chromosome partitioning ATPase
MVSTPVSQTIVPPHAEQPQDHLKLEERMNHIRYKILVLSGKGGVGKSTVAANLAMALSMEGNRVGLLDVDIHGPSIPRLTGLEGKSLLSQDDNILPVEIRNNLKVVSTGFLLPKNTDAVIWRGPRKYHVIRQFLSDVMWGELDYLVVDSPPGTGDEPMAVAQLVGEPSGAVIVTTPQQVAIADVRRCVTFCHELSLPVLGIIENMSGFICPTCGTNINLFRSGGGESLALEMNVPFLGRIPIDPDIVSAGDNGLAFFKEYSRSAAAESFTAIVRQIVAATA